MENVGTVRSVNVSERKGTRKKPVENGQIHIDPHQGVTGDAHAGDWHRQVSLLAWESIEKARAMGLDVKEGDFAENITTEGMDLLALPLGTQVKIGDEVELELSQIGKVCHKKCAIYYLAGDCIFPREGIFFEEDGRWPLRVHAAGSARRDCEGSCRRGRRKGCQGEGSRNEIGFRLRCPNARVISCQGGFETVRSPLVLPAGYVVQSKDNQSARASWYSRIKRNVCTPMNWCFAVC